jgi:DNA-binding CsgD family transcriptional regulator
MPKNLWTKEEIDVLLNAEDKRNITLPNRSAKSIHRKLIGLKLLKPAFKVSQKFSKKAWTNEEIELLKNSKDPRNFKIPGRSKNSICGMAIRLGIADKKPARRPWSKKDEKILLELTKQGKTPIEIVRMKVLPYSRNSIQKKLVAFGLCKKIKFNSDLKIKFKNFLKENYIGKTPRELVDLWNSENQVKVHKRKLCKYLAVYNLSLPSGETIKINNLKKKEAEIKEQEAINSNRRDISFVEAIRKVRVKFMIKRAEKNRNIWTGLPLSKEEILSIELETKA